MKTAEVINLHGEQVIKMPAEFRFSGSSVFVRKAGDSVILEPVKSAEWPAGFFEEIKIDDPAWDRPPQGQMPPAPTI